MLRDHQVLEMHSGTWWNKTNIGLLPDWPRLLIPDLYRLVFCKLRTVPQLGKQADDHLQARGLIPNWQGVVNAWLSVPGLGTVDPKEVETWCTTFPPTEEVDYQPRCEFVQQAH